MILMRFVFVGKSHRLLQELKFHSSLGTGGCTEETLNLDVIP